LAREKEVLKLTGKKRWGSLEKARFKEDFLNPKKHIEELAIEYGRTENSLRLMASRMGLNRPTYEGPEKECFGKKFNDECMRPPKCRDWILCANQYYREFYGVKHGALTKARNEERAKRRS
jgi:hypothetical protein